jgi:hypothetical protein
MVEYQDKLLPQTIDNRIKPETNRHNQCDGQHDCQCNCHPGTTSI